MSEQIKLPGHVTKVSDKWYKNTKTSKFIHVDHIGEFCERYWKAMPPPGTTKAKAGYQKNINAARRRWDNE